MEQHWHIATPKIHRIGLNRDRTLGCTRMHIQGSACIKLVDRADAIGRTMSA